MIGRIGVGICLIKLGIGLIELGIGLIELGIGLRINNARCTILVRVSGLVPYGLTFWNPKTLFDVNRFL